MAQALPESAQAKWHDLGDRHATRDFLRRLCHAAAWPQGPQRYRLGKTESTAEPLLPILHPLDRKRHLGGEKREEQTLLQLSAHEGTQRRQTDDNGVAIQRSFQRRQKTWQAAQ